MQRSKWKYSKFKVRIKYVKIDENILCVFFDRFIDTLLGDIEQYTTAMEVVLTILDHFYEENKLENSAVV